MGRLRGCGNRGFIGRRRVKPSRLKRCRVCKAEFRPLKPLQFACSIDCAQKFAASEREKAEYRKDVVRRLALKTRADWLREAQTEFNAWVRLRDSALPCVSCGRFHEGQWHAGHYLSVGARPELRFNEDNVHKQCAPCNTHLSGNAIAFRIGLIGRIGLERVEALEGPHQPVKYTIEDAKRIKAEYRAKRKALLAEQENMREAA